MANRQARKLHKSVHMAGKHDSVAFDVLFKSSLKLFTSNTASTVLFNTVTLVQDSDV